MSEPRRPLRTRRRPVFSCEECRRRKIKCDRTYPCKHCQQLNAVCNYPEGATPLNSQITPAASLHRIVEPPTPIVATSTASLSLCNLSVSGIRDEYPQRSPQKSWKSPTIYKKIPKTHQMCVLFLKRYRGWSSYCWNICQMECRETRLLQYP
jgi:Fungal Zn(2)-Cys(6) binuclear cluster domain